jgi:hypothetical protein
MYYVECGITSGLRESEVTAAVEAIDGSKAFLRVEREFIHKPNGQAYLPIGVIHFDTGEGKALIELPHEADSGVNRLWVANGKIKEAGQLKEHV